MEMIDKRSDRLNLFPNFSDLPHDDRRLFISESYLDYHKLVKKRKKKYAGVKCLVLNADYTAMSIIRWQTALTLIYKYQDKPWLGVSVVDYYKDEFVLATNGHRYPIPAVIVKNKYLRMSTRKVPFSRKHIFVRDKLTCMYCGGVFPPKELTFDHVIPRDLWKEPGTPTNWNNIVTAS